MTETILLGSLNLRGALEALAPRRVLFVPTAANGLHDRSEIIRVYRSQLEPVAVEILDWDLERQPNAMNVPKVDAIFVSGGNPFRLLHACRSSGFDRALAAFVSAGRPYIGASAGAMVVGPTLEPIATISPFPRPPNFDSSALGLADRLVLPHDDHPGRREAHARAQSHHGTSLRLLTITDDETVTIRGDAWCTTDHVAGHSFRPAVPSDVAAIADCYATAGRSAWTFVDPRRLESMQPPVESWAERLSGVPDPDDLLVIEDGIGLCGFVWARRATDDDLEAGVGEIGALYTRPRVWGKGSGRRLLTLALDRLRATGCDSAVLYTEERNHRPRHIYERLGWRTDGTSRTCDFVGAPIRELRYRLRL